MREHAFIDRLRRRLGRARSDTRLALGDDAAIVAPAAGDEVVVTTDTLIAGRHFPDDTSAFDVGFKSIAVNLSDVAAMGADPAWLTVALSVPQIDVDWCDAFVDGARAAIGEAVVDIIGGDTTRGPLSITVTALGTLPAGGAIRRNGARPGQVIAVTGTLGDAAAGLECLDDGVSDDDCAWLVARLNRPSWRPGARLRGLARAGIDVSDGLAADLGHILEASGVGARVDVDALPCSAALARRSSGDARRRLQLTGGDDYELCVTLDETDVARARDRLECDLTVIGRIEAQPGLRCVDAHGRPWALPDAGRGWDHFG